MNAQGISMENGHMGARRDAHASPRAALDALRTEIEELDAQLVEIVAQRQELARAIAGAKQAAGLPIVDRAREAVVVRAAAARARAAGLDEDAMRQVFWCLIDLSRRAQLGARS